MNVYSHNLASTLARLRMLAIATLLFAPLASTLADEYVIREYDVTALLADRDDRPLRGVHRYGFADREVLTARELLAALAVLDPPDMPNEASGLPGALGAARKPKTPGAPPARQADIKIIDGMLVVRQPPEVQKQIQELLDQLTAQVTRSVRIEACWLYLTRGEYANLVKPSLSPDAESIDSAVLSELLKKKTAVRGEVVCADGQTVNMTVGERALTLAESTAVVAARTATNAPNATFEQDGYALQVTPRVLNGGQRIAIDIYNLVSKPSQRPATVLQTLAPAAADVTVPEQEKRIGRVPGTHRQLVRTSVIVASGEPHLVFATTVNPTIVATKAISDERILCLVLLAE